MKWGLCSVAVLVGCASSGTVDIQAALLNGSGPKGPEASQRIAETPLVRTSNVSEPVLGKLVTQDEVLTVVSSGDGPRFAVGTRSGHIVARGLTADELAAHHPELSEIYQAGTARPFLDARLDLPSRDEP